ncbi:MAG: hypothetical protein UHY90_05990 [Treponema sp.]|nr:hypothetical protein [Spirochaetia bacterium]MDD7460829.1 hypothetical protein [Spirochaetales bacterium]MDY5810963.1 hypothetical protein [Treponema sp.]MEE1181785.1 hypothetical protein [Treponema sp.]
MEALSLRDARKRGKLEGISIGLQQGIQQANISFVKKLLKKGLSTGEISQLVELPVTEVEQISKSIDN